MKRKLIYLFLAILIAGPILSADAGHAANQTIKIGLLFPLTGPMAITGTQMLDVSKLTFGMFDNQVAGHKIELVIGDSGSKPSMAIDTARKMVEDDKVSLIIGPVIGHVKLAVADYLSKVGVVQLFNTPAPWPILTPAMPWSISGAGSEQQISSASGAYAYIAGYRKISIITPDLAHSRGFAYGFKKAFEAKGGKIIQEQFVPSPCNDYASYLTKLQAADALGAWFNGSEAIMFLTQIHEFGIRKKMPVTSIFMGAFMVNYILDELPAAAADAVVGEITTTPYSPFLKHAENQKFVEITKSKYGRRPDDTGSTTYDTCLIAIKALEATGGDVTPELLRNAILDVNFMATQGPVFFDKSTRCRIRNIYACPVIKESGKYDWGEPVYTFKDVPPVGFAPPPPPPK